MDATDVAFAGVISTALVGSLAMVFGYFNSRSDRRQARQLAHDERLFARRADIYVDLLNFVLRQVDVVNRTYRMLESPRLPQPPPDLPEDEVRLLQARLVAFRSPETIAALESVNAKLREFSYEVETLRGLEGQGQGLRQGSPDYMAHHLKLQQVKEEIRARVQALEDQVATELTRPPGSSADRRSRRWLFSRSG